VEQDSNLRRHKPTDLQSVPFDRFGIHPYGLPAIASALDSLYDPPSLKLWRAAAAPATEDTAEATAGAENGIRTRDLFLTMEAVNPITACLVLSSASD
jgi:hypothetical protein